MRRALAWIVAYFAARRAARVRRHMEELRRLSDDFGNGPLLRYGEDRWGKPR